MSQPAGLVRKAGFCVVERMICFFREDLPYGSTQIAQLIRRVGRPHSKSDFWLNRVGADPLETGLFLKTSGYRPTRTENFTLDEWVDPLRKITYNVK